MCLDLPLVCAMDLSEGFPCDNLFSFEKMLKLIIIAVTTVVKTPLNYLQQILCLSVRQLQVLPLSLVSLAAAWQVAQLDSVRVSHKQEAVLRKGQASETDREKLLFALANIHFTISILPVSALAVNLSFSVSTCPVAALQT